MCVQISLSVPAFNFWGYLPRSGSTVLDPFPIEMIHGCLHAAACSGGLLPSVCKSLPPLDYEFLGDRKPVLDIPTLQSCGRHTVCPPEGFTNEQICPGLLLRGG